MEMEGKAESRTQKAELAFLDRVTYHDFMSKDHDKGHRKVAEPVQVYLDQADRGRLERLTEQLDTTKSDVLRRALEALERQLADPESHPALRIMSIAEGIAPATALDYDVAVEHDRFLAESEEASWRSESKTPRKRARRAAEKRG